MDPPALYQGYYKEVTVNAINGLLIHKLYPKHKRIKYEYFTNDITVPNRQWLIVVTITYKEKVLMINTYILDSSIQHPNGTVCVYWTYFYSLVFTQIFSNKQK